MDDLKIINQLTEQAKLVRKTLIQMIYTAQSGHPGGSLSAADIVTALYFHEMKIDPNNPKWDNRDRFVLSKGHVCPVLYACLGLKGYFAADDLYTLRQHGSKLQGHPDMKSCPGVDISTGSLGQGLSAAVGMALRAKRDKMSYRVFSLLGDGECNEGQIWEAVETASKYGLDNLVIFVDNNNLQNDGTCADIMPTLDLAKKFDAFGCDAYRIDGHNMKQIFDTLNIVRNNKGGKPICIVCNTVKGKGVSFMENRVEWHGMAPNEEQYMQALKDIEEGF